MENKKVVLGMSGGVDSSVAALLLQKEGYEVVGVFMKNYSDAKNEMTGECTWREEKRMAQRVANLLNIPFYFIDEEKNYRKKVIDKMFRDYARGLTPNPDILCNKIIKFSILFKKARELKARYIATGHYARIRKGKAVKQLLRGRDASKDQSYFLFTLKQKEINRLIFPVGDLKKEDVRAVARRAGLPNWDKKGTRGICFIGKTDMKLFLKKRLKGKKGKIFSADGEEIGEHAGSIFFTIGERIRENEHVVIENWARNKFGKLYVAQKKRNIIIAVPRSHSLLRTREVFLKNLHLVNPREDVFCKNYRARIRHLGDLHSGKLVRRNSRAIFIFGKPVKSIAEGQFLVFYDGERVVGGGEMRTR